MLGQILLTLDAFGLIFGAIMADWNETHIFNPRFTPHAKFHVGHTISLSVSMGLATLYFTWWPLFTSKSRPVATMRQLKRDSLNIAVCTGTIYWLTGLAAILYPGTDGVDPEFGPPGSFPQGRFFTAFATFAVAGWLLERQASK
ncbi:hypothetical protein B0H66DRAFT_100508 [Apodospora peruviana]|uniref:Uncharacterized protein n=1 Tax=Apodospora peruviana TaxID=516989 RepID=A0AAE0LYW4_9PEZI|nr:hypothetical protein B0H66DRAFT_100508 [Apodospora peruviana]